MHPLLPVATFLPVAGDLRPALETAPWELRLGAAQASAVQTAQPLGSVVSPGHGAASHFPAHTSLSWPLSSRCWSALPKGCPRGDSWSTHSVVTFVLSCWSAWNRIPGSRFCPLSPGGSASRPQHRLLLLSCCSSHCHVWSGSGYSVLRVGSSGMVPVCCFTHLLSVEPQGRLWPCSSGRCGRSL